MGRFFTIAHMLNEEVGMQNQKIENLLNLALEATQQEREKSIELEVGFNQIEKNWDLIVKYSGDLSEIRQLGISVVGLQNEYAIITIKESLIEQLAAFPQIEYIEKPKRLFFDVVQGKNVSCITSVQSDFISLTGQDVLVAVIDSGIDYENRVFRNFDGSTRILNLWDQTISGNPPEGYTIGTEYTRDEINEALEGFRLLPSIDSSGHGTAVAGVLAGNSEQYQGIAIQSELLIVKLGIPSVEGFPRTTELMQALDYVIRKALEYRKPVAVNLSFGNSYGAHDGTSLLEQYIEDIANTWKSVICIGSGNEGNGSGHISGRISKEEDLKIELAVQENELGFNVQIWKAYFDEMDIILESPSGIRVGPIQEVLGTQRFTLGGTQILLYYGEPKPYSIDQEIFIDFIPTNVYVTSGIWKIILSPRKIIRGDFAMWLPSKNLINEGTGFLFSSPNGTITIPATAYRTIAVGAYDSRTMTYADFSGRGYGMRIKPDLVAPGVDILAPVPGGSFGEFSGTSFATSFVTGSAALMMEWGIVNGNDPYLYGEKVKAYLQRGAEPILGFEEYPNVTVGYGALCLEGSLP